tara:strand:+ start:169 stop:375 length:207 start_codon:yes stop_codon:yes gene_type:complete
MDLEMEKYSTDLVGVDGHLISSFNTDHLEDANDKFKELKKEGLNGETIQLWERGEFESLELIKGFDCR